MAADDLRSSTAAQVAAVQADLADYAGVEKVWQAIRHDGRPVAALALNAGVGLGGDFTHDQDLGDALRLVRLNVKSTVHLAKRVLPQMAARGDGKILFTSSIASESPGPYQALYNASKSFVQSFAEALADGLRDSGVTVTALMPGPTDTEFFEWAGLEDTKLGAGRRTIQPSSPSRASKRSWRATPRSMRVASRRRLRARPRRCCPTRSRPPCIAKRPSPARQSRELRAAPGERSQVNWVGTLRRNHATRGG